MRLLIHSREMFRPSNQVSSNTEIIVHNHHSGEVEPSTNDVDVTKLLKEAGNVVGIEMLDHIIIGTEGFVSLKKK